jgi:hypothetical protein
METMQDLLGKVQEFASHSFTKEEARSIFGWDVSCLLASGSKGDESNVRIAFENGYNLLIKYFLNLDPTQTDETCEFVFSLKTDLTSRIKYGIH